MKIIEIYEYGNGKYTESFWTRVQDKIDEVEKRYKIINMEVYFMRSKI